MKNYGIMVTQKLISLKIDCLLLEDLDTECLVSQKKRNWVINRAVHAYLTMQDCRRLIKCVGSEENKKSVLNTWLREEIPEAATW